MAAGDLTDLDSVKAWLGLSSDVSANDGLLSALITAASGFVTQYLGRDLTPATYTEVYDARGGRTMLLRQAPITAVQAVSFAGVTISQMGDPIVGAPGFWFDGRRLSLIGECFPARGLVVVTYTAGYETLPTSLVQAVNELVGEAFRRRERIGQSSKSLGGQETVAFSTADMNAAVKTALASFIAVAPV
jgi:hypothetical protein